MRLIGVLGIALLIGACNTNQRKQESSQPAQQPAVTEPAQAPAPPAAEAPKTEPERAKTPAVAPKDPPPPVARRSAATEQRAAEKNINPDALILTDFTHRIDAYMRVHKDAAKDAPSIKETHDPAKIQNAQEGLAAKIRELRADAKPGEIFTPEIRNQFQRLMYPQVVGTTGREVKQELTEDVHERDEGEQKPVPLKVNASYPKGNALPTVPANVLLSLPKLPEELEYRVIGKNLILRDVQANIIVDYIPNVIH